MRGRAHAAEKARAGRSSGNPPWPDWRRRKSGFSLLLGAGMLSMNRPTYHALGSAARSGGGQCHRDFPCGNDRGRPPRRP